MSDLKTALKNAILAKEINEWDNEENQRMNPNQKGTNAAAANKGFTVTNNVMRACFDSVKASPGLTTAQHVAALEKKGFKPTSTTSVLSQLVRSGQVRKDEERKLFVAQSEYTPVKTAKRKEMTRKAQTVKVMGVRKKEAGNTHQSSPDAAGITALEPKTKPVKTWAPDEVVNTLNVVQARQLFDYLKKLFGG